MSNLLWRGFERLGNAIVMNEHGLPVVALNLPAELTAIGTPVALLTPEGLRDARVVKTPWFEPQKIIPPGIAAG